MTDKPIDEIIEKLRMYCSATGYRPEGVEGRDYEILSDAQIMVEVPELEAVLGVLSCYREALGFIANFECRDPRECDWAQDAAREALKKSKALHAGAMVRTISGGVYEVMGISEGHVILTAYDAEGRHSFSFKIPRDEVEIVTDCTRPAVPPADCTGGGEDDPDK